MRVSPLAFVALVPLMLGTTPVAARTGQDLIAPLCGGRFVVIHLGGSGKAPPAPPCAIKGCHAGCTRRFLDPEQ